MSDEVEIHKDSSPFVVLPVYNNWTKKFWVEGKPPENSDFLSVMAGEVTPRAIRLQTIYMIWPFDDKTTIVEVGRGGLVIDMPFGEVYKRVNRGERVTMTHKDTWE